MSEEEKEDLLYVICDISRDNDLVRKAYDYINKLEQENNQLKKDKKKIREYINTLSDKPDIFGHYGIDGDCRKWLLKLLGDEENE